jgi:hypothetical protein
MPNREIEDSLYGDLNVLTPLKLKYLYELKKMLNYGENSE